MVREIKNYLKYIRVKQTADCKKAIKLARERANINIPPNWYIRSIWFRNSNSAWPQKIKNIIKKYCYFSFFLIWCRTSNADVAELADALDSKSSGKPCGFESHHRYQNRNELKLWNFLFFNLSSLYLFVTPWSF